MQPLKSELRENQNLELKNQVLSESLLPAIEDIELLTTKNFDLESFEKLNKSQKLRFLRHGLDRIEFGIKEYQRELELLKKDVEKEIKYNGLNEDE